MNPVINGRLTTEMAMRPFGPILRNGYRRAARRVGIEDLAIPEQVGMRDAE
jgi:hypothetical protein